MAEDQIERIHLFYEMAMSIGQSMDLEDMLKQSLSVFLQKLNCTSGGVFLYVKPGQLQPKLRSFLLPRIFAGTEEFTRISTIVNDLITERISTDVKVRLITPIQFHFKTSYNLIMEMPDTGFIFFCNPISDFDENLILTLQELIARLSGACIACYQNDALIQSQYDLELRIAHRTQEIEKRNKELKSAYDKLQKAQKQLIHSEKMVSLGQLAAGVAHEINNPTGFISSNLHTMTEYFNVIETFYKLTSELLENINTNDNSGSVILAGKILNLIDKEDIPFIVEDGNQLIVESIDGAERIKEIVAGLRNFGRSDDSELKDANINDAIENALKLTWNTLKYKCEVDKNLSELPDIPCKKDQLTQVFVNIFVNASQAIEAHGLVSVKSYVQENFIIVKIADNGMGIPEENLSKLFDPFFTTKDIGKGTGLGLSISHGIIEKHSGTISVESIVGKGTIFTIRLPIN